MQLIWQTQSLEIIDQEIIYVQHSSDPYLINLKGVKSCLLINSNQMEIWEKQNLEKIYLSTGRNFDQLKEFLTGSPFTSLLRTSFSRLSRQDQLRIIRDIAILNDVDLVHFKDPLDWFMSIDLDHFLMGIRKPAVVESTKPCRLLSACWRIDATGTTKLTNKLPETLESVEMFDSKQRFHVKIQQNQEGPVLQLENLSFPLDNDQTLKLMGMMNQSLVMVANANDFEISKKIKPGFLKIDMIQQSFRGGRWLQSFSIQDQTLTRFSDHRARTPFLFIRPDLDRCWIFSADTRKRIYPKDGD